MFWELPRESFRRIVHEVVDPFMLSYRTTLGARGGVLGSAPGVLPVGRSPHRRGVDIHMHDLVSYNIRGTRFLWGQLLES